MAFYIFTMFLRACPAILALDLQASFTMEEPFIALISSATPVGYAIMQLPTGLITDLAGGRKTIRFFIGRFDQYGSYCRVHQSADSNGHAFRHRAFSGRHSGGRVHVEPCFRRRKNLPQS